MSSRDVNLVDGDLVKPLLVLSIPIVLSQLMQVGYNLINTFWVGHLGADAVSAISFSFPIVFFIISLAGGFAVAGTVLVAQHKGAGNHDEVDHVAGQTIAFTILVSVVVSIIGWVASPWMVTMIGATPGTHIHAWAVDYTRTIFLGIFFMFGFFMFQALLRGWGDTRTPMYLMLFGVVVNVLLDPFLIYGFSGNILLEVLHMGALQTQLLHATGFTGMGVEGAAIATVISRALGALVGIGLLFTGRVGIHLSIADLRLKLDTVRQIVKIGTPAGLDQSTRALGIIVLTAIVALAGPKTVAAFGIGNRLNSLVFLPALGFAQGTATVVGQNLGAHKADRAKRAVVVSASIVAAVLVGFTLVAFVFAEPIVGIFLSSGTAKAADVIALGAAYLRIIGPTFLFIGAFQVVLGAFRGSGNTQTAMVFSIVSLWVFRIPVAYLLSTQFGFGANGIWYGIAFSNVAATVLAVAWFTRGTWAKAVIDDGSPSTPTAALAADLDADLPESE